MIRDCRRACLLAIALLVGGSLLAQQAPQAVLDQDARIAQLALEAASRGPAMPVPLAGEMGRTIAAVYDQYVIGVVIARQLIASGLPANPGAITAHPLWRSRGTVVVAYPIDCDGRPNHPVAIRWKLSRPAPVEPQIIGEAVRGSNAQTLLPGIGLPDDALAVNLRNALPSGATVEVDYGGPVCRGAATTTSLPVGFSPSVALATSFNGIKLPDAQSTLPSPTTVHVRVLLDATGRARFPEALDGPEELRPIALDMLTARTYPPATSNGVAMPMSQIASFVFTRTGERDTAEPYRPVATPGVMMTTGAPIATPTTGSSTPPPVLPPAPPEEFETNIARLAIEIAQKGDPVPVPLDAAGPALHGVIFDRFLVAAVKARAAIVSGKSLDPSAATHELVHEDAVAVAFALTCSGRSIAPTGVEMWAGGTRPGPVPAKSAILSGDALAERLPGVRLPDGAVGRTFQAAPFSQNVEIRVTYNEAPCGGEAKTLSLPIQWVRGSSIRRMSIAKLPEKSPLPSPLAVQMRGMVDLDGAYRFPTVADGPAELAGTAMVIASSWRWQPYRANGVPLPQGVVAALTFTTTGAPDGVPPPGAPATPTSTTSASEPPILTTSTIGGRPEELSTPESPGLTARSSLCAIANTSTFGFAPAAPIKTGGGPAAGPARERQYLSVLRGPAGQGLRITRRGSMLGPDGSTILDVYEVTHEGLATPLRLYLDVYHDGILQSPQGLACAAPIAIR